MTRAPSFPCSLGVDWDSGTSYDTIGQVRDIEGPTISRNEVEVPLDHDATNNYMNYFAGAADGGELTFSVNLDTQNSLHVGGAGTGLLGSFEEEYNYDVPPAWQFQNTGGPGTATWTFDGFVTGFEPAMGAVEGVMEADVTVKIDGKPTLTIT